MNDNMRRILDDERYNSRESHRRSNYPDNPEMRRRRDSRGRYMTYDTGRIGYGERMDTRRYPDEERLPDHDYYRDDRSRSMMHDDASRGNMRVLRGSGELWLDHDDKLYNEPLTREEAIEWVENMKNEDPKLPEGPKWSPQDAKQYAQRMGYPTDGDEFWEMYAVMNAMYSDYGEVLKKYGLTDPSVYASLAKAFLDDKDACDNKAAVYYRCIVCD